MTLDYFIACLLLREWLYSWSIDRYLEIILNKTGIPEDPGKQEPS